MLKQQTSSGLTAAVYARFSTDLQNERSTQDQIDLCTSYARREGLHIVSTFQDQARSGSSMHGRDGLHQLLDAAHRGLFQVIIVEALDRLSRDIEDLAGIYKRLSFAGIKLLAVHEGEANTVLIGLRGLVGQMYREDNVHKVRRGMTGLIKQGLTAGGRAYGYRSDPANTGKPTIVEQEAIIVRRIFTEYQSGNSPKAICRRLNAERITAPRGKKWAPSALIGSEERGSGMFRNQIYVGRIIWNKVRMVKDPDTGKRVSRPNPESEWHIAEAPELRIVPAELFESAHRQLKSRSHTNRKDNMAVHRRPKRLLSGLLVCGACRSGMAVAGVDKSGKTRLRCSAHTNSGSCPAPKSFYLEEVEEMVISSLTRELASPEKIFTYAKTYMEKRHADAAYENRQRNQIESRLLAIEKDNALLLDWMLQGVGDHDSLAAKMKSQGQEKDSLKVELRALPASTNVTVHPAAIKAFAQRLQNNRPKLEMALHLLDDLGELPGLIRGVIKSITLDKTEKGAIKMDVTNWLAPFLTGESAPQIIGAGSLVAGEGLEPPTRGL
ncbi:recombinase family protein [Agrobacterium sp. rho-13.3]|uniref:recombinase family protein n=1 Tax=Agrobacterium sp. rho-13.3 TaxID=3072980 RepID=UPI002A0DACE3|nr:recombinase family protein [Agrobacterium sp. rho-13.3]MDX8307799.1 recombinase family protein [Agrobacterium sp. rho-13.3]